MRYPDARFNDTGQPLARATRWCVPARAREGDHRTRRARRGGVSRGAGAARREQVRRRPRHDRSRRGAAPRRLGAWTPGVNRQAVAELTICFMIALCRSVVPLARDLAAGGWRHRGGRQLSSATVGIVGCGHVGQTGRAAMPRLRRDGRRARHPRPTRFYREHGVTPVALDALLERRGYRDAPCAARRIDARPDRRACAGADEADAFLDQHGARRASWTSGAEARARRTAPRRRRVRRLRVEPPVDRELLPLPDVHRHARTSAAAPRRPCLRWDGPRLRGSMEVRRRSI